MRKLPALLWLLVIFSLTLPAQDDRKMEVYGGYSHLSTFAGENTFGGSGLGFNGGSGAFTFNVNRWLGLTGDFGGYHNKDKVSGIRTNDFTYLFGPTITYRGNQRAVPFFHFLVGAMHQNSYIPGFSTNTITVPATTVFGNGFAAAPGGGLNVNLSSDFAFRVVQADYLFSQSNLPCCSINNTTGSGLRISTGAVFKW